MEESYQETENQQEYIGNTSIKKNTMKDAEEKIAAERNTMEEGTTGNIAVMAES